MIDLNDYPSLSAMSMEEILVAPVELLNLSIRSRKCMRKFEVRTIGDLTRLSANELMEKKNFGVISLADLREKLADIDLKLRDD